VKNDNEKPFDKTSLICEIGSRRRRLICFDGTVDPTRDLLRLYTGQKTITNSDKRTSNKSKLRTTQKKMTCQEREELDKNRRAKSREGSGIRFFSGCHNPYALPSRPRSRGVALSDTVASTCDVGDGVPFDCLPTESNEKSLIRKKRQKSK
jgi:hypothetical protein